MSSAIASATTIATINGRATYCTSASDGFNSNIESPTNADSRPADHDAADDRSAAPEIVDIDQAYAIDRSD
jgi:hypothetical protein